MTLDNLIAAWRVEIDDAVGPEFLCSDETATRFANEAQREACRRSRLILDSTTDEVCRLVFAAGDETIDLDRRILFIRRAKLDGRAVLLQRKHMQDMDAEAPGWEAHTGEPRGWITGLDDGKLRPYPIPTAAGVIHLTVVRLPLEDLTDGQDEPEIKEHLQAGLRHYMAYLFYSLPDAEIKDPQKAVWHLAEFEREFGKKSSAFDEAWLQREADHLEAEGNY